jgi:hypothetical protein
MAGRSRPSRSGHGSPDGRTTSRRRCGRRTTPAGSCSPHSRWRWRRGRRTGWGRCTRAPRRTNGQRWRTRGPGWTGPASARGVAGHELGVLLIGGLAGELGEERADVVGEEPVHGGLLVRVLRGVEGRLRLEDPAVGLVQDPEQLGGGTPHPDRARGCSWWARCHRARPCGPRRARPSQGAGCSAPCRLRPRRPPPHRAGTADRAGCRTSGSRTSPQPRDPAQPGGQQRPSRVPFHRLGTRSPAAPTGPWTSGNQPAASPRRDDLLASKLPAPRLGALASAPLDRTDPALLTTRATAFARAAWFRITRCGG